jgi:hypothetical protein
VFLSGSLVIATSLLHYGILNPVVALGITSRWPQTTLAAKNRAATIGREKARRKYWGMRGGLSRALAGEQAAPATGIAKMRPTNANNKKSPRQAVT